jgi:hypothetical protein
MADEAAQRAAFRRWVRENHPDVGGDPVVFAAGVQAAREGRWEQFEGNAARAAAPPAEEPAPPVFVRKSARGLAKLIVTAERWYERRRRPPRVR